MKYHVIQEGSPFNGHTVPLFENKQELQQYRLEHGANPFVPFKPPFRYDKQGAMIFDANDQLMIEVRGWGFLIGQAPVAQGLPEVQAQFITDAIGKELVTLLNNRCVQPPNTPKDPPPPPSATATPS